MRTWFSIANMLAILCIVIMMMITMKNVEICEAQFNESKLVTATEYAAEAAFISSIAISENQTTYSSIDATLLTKDTLRVFCDMMSISFDMAIGESNDVAIEESIAAICLAGNDGYYLADKTEVGKGEFRLVWSPKLPYSITLKRAGSSTTDTLAVTLTDERWFLAKGSGHEMVTGETHDELLTYLSENGITWVDTNNTSDTVTLDDVFYDSIVSAALTNSMGYRLKSSTEKEDYILYVPTIQTYTGLNGITSPSLLIVVNNARYSNYKGPCSTMQGFKIVWKPKVIAYTLTDEYNQVIGRRYCYEGQTQYVDGNISGTLVFNSLESAARAGYEPDIYALMQPIKIGY